MLHFAAFGHQDPFDMTSVESWPTEKWYLFRAPTSVFLYSSGRDSSGSGFENDRKTTRNSRLSVRGGGGPVEGECVARWAVADNQRKSLRYLLVIRIDKPRAPMAGMIIEYATALLSAIRSDDVVLLDRSWRDFSKRPSSEIEHFKRATDQTPFLLWGFLQFKILECLDSCDSNYRSLAISNR